MAVQSTGTANLNSTTVPTPTGDWTYCCFVNVGLAPTGAPTQNQLAFVSSAGAQPGCYMNRDQGTTTWTAYIWDGSNADVTTISSSVPIGWTFVYVRHAAGSANYEIGWKSPIDSGFTTDTLTLGAQLTGLTTLWIASDSATEQETNASFRSYTCQAAYMSDAALLTVSQSLSAPAGANLHFLALVDDATAATNTGTAANWTKAGTFTNVADPPVGSSTVSLPKTLAFAHNF